MRDSNTERVFEELRARPAGWASLSLPAYRGAVVYVAIIIGPPAMAQGRWADWQAAHQHVPAFPAGRETGIHERWSVRQADVNRAAAERPGHPSGALGTTEAPSRSPASAKSLRSVANLASAWSSISCAHALQ